MKTGDMKISFMSIGTDVMVRNSDKNLNVFRLYDKKGNPLGEYDAKGHVFYREIGRTPSNAQQAAIDAFTRVGIVTLDLEEDV